MFENCNDCFYIKISRICNDIFSDSRDETTVKIEIDESPEYLSYLTQSENISSKNTSKNQKSGGKRAVILNDPKSMFNFTVGSIYLPKLVKIFLPDRTRNLKNQNVFFAIEAENQYGQKIVKKCHLGQARFGRDKLGREDTFRITCPKRVASSSKEIDINGKVRKYCPFSCILKVLISPEKLHKDFFRLENWSVLANLDAKHHLCAPSVDCFSEIQKTDGRTHFDSMTLDKFFEQGLRSLDAQDFPFTSGFPGGSIFFPKFVKMYQPVKLVKYQNFYVAVESDSPQGKKVVKKCILRSMPSNDPNKVLVNSVDSSDLLTNPILGIHKLICSVTKPYCPFFCIIRAILTINPKDPKYFNSENWAILENSGAQNHVCPDNKGLAD